jgi:hypothetical protein
LELASTFYFVTVQAMQRSSQPSWCNLPEYFVKNKIIEFPFMLFFR